MSEERGTTQPERLSIMNRRYFNEFVRPLSSGSKMIRGNPDLLFTEDGSVRLPKLAGLAIGLASKSHGCITRQPTRERASAVAEAIRERVEQRGLAMEIRPGKKTDTFGVYVLPNARESLEA